MKKTASCMAFILLTVLSFNSIASTQTSEIRAKYTELKIAIEDESRIKEIAQDAKQTSRLSKTIGFASLGVVTPGITVVASEGIAEVILATTGIGWSRLHVPLALSTIAVTVAAIAGEEYSAISEGADLAKRKSIDEAYVIDDIKNKAEDYLNSQSALENIKQAKVAIDEQIKLLYENEMDGSIIHDLQDRVTFGSFTAKIMKKLYVLKKTKRLLIEREIKILEAKRD